MAEGSEIRITDSPLRDTNVGFREPVRDMLDRMIKAVEETGERTSRSELLAALIVSTAIDGESLGHTIRRYRTTTMD